MMGIDDILEKYGNYGRTGRVVFKHRGYVMIAKRFGLNWNKMSHNDKIFLKGEMIDQYAGTGTINEDRWQEADTSERVQFICPDCNKPEKEYRDGLCEMCHKWHTS